MPAVVAVPQHLQRRDVLALAARLLEDLTQVGGDDGVGGEDEGGLVIGRVDGGSVDVLGFRCGGCEDVFEWWQGVGLVFGDCGGDDFEVCEADLGEGVSLRRGLNRWTLSRTAMRLTCANNCLLLGEADARITRLPRIMFKAGRSSGNGGRGPRGCPPPPLDFSGMGIGLSVYGGGSMGTFSSDMVAM